MKLQETESEFLKQLALEKASWEDAVAQAVDSENPDLMWSSNEEAWGRKRLAPLNTTSL